MNLLQQNTLGQTNTLFWLEVRIRAINLNCVLVEAAALHINIARVDPDEEEEDKKRFLNSLS